MLGILILFFLVGLVLIVNGLIKTKPWKNTKPKSLGIESDKSEIDGYTLYLQMCKNNSEEPINLSSNIQTWSKQL